MPCLSDALGEYISKAKRYHADRKSSCAAKVTYQSAPISVDAQDPTVEDLSMSITVMAECIAQH